MTNQLMPAYVRHNP